MSREVLESPPPPPQMWFQSYCYYHDTITHCNLRLTTFLSFGGKKYLGLRTISLAPIQRSLIDVSLLTDDELQWVNSYHEEVSSSECSGIRDAKSRILSYVTWGGAAVLYFHVQNRSGGERAYTRLILTNCAHPNTTKPSSGERETNSSPRE